MTIITRKINPGVADPFSWDEAAELTLPSKLPAESQLEIRDTNNPTHPFEARLITVKECSEAEAATENQFVTVIVRNRTNQDFHLRLGQANVEGWYRNTDDIMEVNRDLVDHILIGKKIKKEKDQEATPPPTTNCLTRIFAAFCACLKQLLEKLRACIHRGQASQ